MGIRFNPITSQFDLVGTTGGGGPVDAIDVSVTPVGNLTSTNVQDALEELQGDIDHFTSSFNNTTDWSGPSAGFYTITYLESAHLKGANPQVMIAEVDGINFNIVDVDRIQINASGDIVIRVNETPDLRFNGKIIIS